MPLRFEVTKDHQEYLRVLAIPNRIFLLSKGVGTSLRAAKIGYQISGKTLSVSTMNLIM
jgi:hypothetical protein